MLESKRIKLTSLNQEDVNQEYLDTLNDLQYMRYSRNSRFCHTIDSQIRYIRDFNSSNDLIYAIRRVEDGKLLGSINCYIDFINMNLSLGFLVFKGEQGKGYATEALDLLIQYLENQFPGMTLVIGTKRANTAMRKIALNLKFEQQDSPSVLNDGNIKLTRKLPLCRREFSFGVPDFIVNSKSIGVVAYDAGGAEQIAWLLGNLTQTPLAFVEGPAIKVFQNLGVRHRVASDLREVLKCSLIITGSGWMSNLELTAIKLARSMNLPCVTLLDHWVNYLERFGENEDEKPLILAVTNSEAMRLAQEMFPNKIVWLLPNFQIESYRNAIQSQKSSSSEVLIMLEPFSDLDTEFAVNENLVHELILHLLSLRQKKEFQSIRVRLHPSQLENEYILNWLMAYEGEIQISNSPLLLDDLKKSKLVIGFNSYALYVSSKCEIPSFSCFAGSSKHWTKFFPEIQKLQL